ncbi:hypothetical protein BAE36_04330 [Rhizobium leguminosarum bv. trifolii]|uniref:Uncharacterized protein n=1 Tax=Rhizobium leguminosarum bv. trifolii TaxID=386 RepID=A0A1B8RHN8_RHILT|nr:hypothetical protein [Rhizobium leguminosarum]AOO88637.1 hypothetical protein [Rhizobium leguminosarum bv. trifolii]OBY08342.1 hypothetical protein BAE36_04330 [Rhizobium leguminosarum bv. trifolii]
MYLKNLLNAVDNLEAMPVEIHELADQLTLAGCQDRILFFPDAELDPAVLRGVHYKYTTRNGVYSDPMLTTLIIYAEGLSLDWQRVVCCKELIHTCDSEVERTNTEDEVIGLVDKLLGPLSTENFGVADIMATKDKLALYQALAILFPLAARQQAIDALGAKTRTPEEIASWVKLPLPLVEMVLETDWPNIREWIVTL